MNEHFTLHPRTVVMMKALGVLLARDLSLAEWEGKGEAAEMVAVARRVLVDLDTLDTGGDEDNDRSLTEMALAPGMAWVDLAEQGLIDASYVRHVVGHHGVMEGDTPPSVRAILYAIEECGGEELDQFALAFPEYVGLVRALPEPGVRERLLAVVGR